MNANCRNGWTSNVVSHFYRTSQDSKTKKKSAKVCSFTGRALRVCLSSPTSRSLQTSQWNETNKPWASALSASARARSHTPTQRSDSIVITSSVAMAIGETKIKKLISFFFYRWNPVASACLVAHKSQITHPPARGSRLVHYPKLRARNTKKKKRKPNTACFLRVTIHPFDLRGCPSRHCKHTNIHTIEWYGRVFC